MDIRKALDIAIKDIKEVFSSIAIYGPMLGVPIFFAITLPIMTFYVTIYGAQNVLSKVAITASLTAGQLAGATTQVFMQYFAVNILGPIFLTMPILTASVIAADSFSGEKERKTAEALLATPVKVSEMLLGKILASFIPTVVLTVVIFGIYGGIVNLLAYQIFHSYVLPTVPWVLMIATSPFLALAAIGFIVLISSKVKGVKEAQQLSTLLVLPILVIPFASVLGVAVLDATFFIYAIAALLLLDAVVLYVGIKSFRKEAIL